MAIVVDRGSLAVYRGMDRAVCRGMDRAVCRGMDRAVIACLNKKHIGNVFW